MGVTGMRGVGEEYPAAKLAQLGLVKETRLTMAELRTGLLRSGSAPGSGLTLTGGERRLLLRAVRALQGKVTGFNRTVAAEHRVELSPYLVPWCEGESVPES